MRPPSLTTVSRSRALQLTVRSLTNSGIDHALIGAFALGLHGAPRNTGDLDLIACDDRLFERSTWKPLADAGFEIDIRVGDAEDSLAGVVRIAPESLLPTDVIMPKGRWVRTLLDRSVASGRRVRVAGVELLLVEPADLVLTKLYAGGPTDHHDIIDLLAHHAELERLVAAIDERVTEQPARCARSWSELRDAMRRR
jgi:hypothetical protein